MHDTDQPPTTPAGHLVISEPLRDQIRERLLGLLDAETLRVERMDVEPEGWRDRAADLLEVTEAIRSALARLDAGVYGTCEGCGEPIPFERLDAIPTASSCVACQQRVRPLVG